MIKIVVDIYFELRYDYIIHKINEGDMKNVLKTASLLLIVSFLANFFAFTLAFAEEKESDMQETTYLSIREIADMCQEMEAMASEEEWRGSGEEVAFAYPITADSDEWKNFDTHLQMLEACTAPAAVLECASTEELLQLAKDYPLMVDMFAYNSLEQGLAAVIMQSNIFSELVRRDDAQKYCTGII